MDGSGELFRGLVTVLPEELETETLWYPADRYMKYGELAGTLRGAIPWMSRLCWWRSRMGRRWRC